MVSGKFVGMFNLWQRELERLGYVNFARVLNAKDYGVPQNRERIFLVSIRMDDLEGIAGNIRYHFPKPFPLTLRLKDVLEKKVDEKYYLSDDKIEEMFANGCGVDDSDIYDTDKNRAQYDLERYNETLFNEEAKTELCDNYQDEELPPPDVKVEGRINSSQDGVVVSKEGIAPCHTAGHGNCPKIKE
jgi:site-specific DNA-cytosine methylase